MVLNLDKVIGDTVKVIQEPLPVLVKRGGGRFGILAKNAESTVTFLINKNPFKYNEMSKYVCLLFVAADLLIIETSQ